MNKLKKMRRYVKCRRALRILLGLGILIGFLGFLLVLGAVGSIEINRVSERDGILLAILGLAMFTGGVSISKLLWNWEELYEAREWYAKSELSADDVVGNMTYMKNCDCWVVCVDYRDETAWKYCLCTEKGRPISTPIRSYDEFSKYNWTII